MTEVDPRLAARRRSVQEGWARRRLRWMMLLVGALLLVGGSIALFESPWLAVRSVLVDGAESSAVDEILASQGVTRGSPTVAVRPGSLEEALRTDPWVEDAEVRVVWPGTVEITVIERTPAAWVRLDDGWALATADGWLVANGDPGEGEPRIPRPPADAEIGQRLRSPELLGAVELLGLLPAELAVGATAEVTDGGIEARIAGHRVLAGNERDVAPKVATLEAMLEEGVRPGAVINVVSPTRPGVLNPRSIVESIREDVSSWDETG